MKRILMVAAMAAVVPAAAFAQEGGAAEPEKPIARATLSAELDADYAQLDADHNGKVTPAEISERLVKSAQEQIDMFRKERDAAFGRLDTNGDGTISRAEFDEKAKLPTAKEPNAAPVLAQFDANKDGSISKDEFRAPTLSNFDKADKNHDGIVTPSERTAVVTPKKAPAKGTPPIKR